MYYQKYKNAVIKFKEIHEHDVIFINQLYKAFTDISIDKENEITIDKVYDRLKSWYMELDNINKVSGIYDNNALDNFIDVFNQIGNKNPRDFILEEIKCIYGFDKQDLILSDKVPEIIDRIKSDKQAIEQGYYIVRDKIVANIKEIFDISEVSFVRINERINLWYEN